MKLSHPRPAAFGPPVPEIADHRIVKVIGSRSLAQTITAYRRGFIHGRGTAAQSIRRDAIARGIVVIDAQLVPAPVFGTVPQPGFIVGIPYFIMVGHRADGAVGKVLLDAEILEAAPKQFVGSRHVGRIGLHRDGVGRRGLEFGAEGVGHGRRPRGGTEAGETFVGDAAARAHAYMISSIRFQSPDGDAHRRQVIDTIERTALGIALVDPCRPVLGIGIAQDSRFAVGCLAVVVLTGLDGIEVQNLRTVFPHLHLISLGKTVHLSAVYLVPSDTDKALPRAVGILPDAGCRQIAGPYIRSSGHVAYADFRGRVERQPGQLDVFGGTVSRHCRNGDAVGVAGAAVYVGLISMARDRREIDAPRLESDAGEGQGAAGGRIRERLELQGDAFDVQTALVDTRCRSQDAAVAADDDAVAGIDRQVHADIAVIVGNHFRRLAVVGTAYLEIAGIDIGVGPVEGRDLAVRGTDRQVFFRAGKPARIDRYGDDRFLARRDAGDRRGDDAAGIFVGADFQHPVARTNGIARRVADTRLALALAVFRPVGQPRGPDGIAAEGEQAHFHRGSLVINSAVFANLARERRKRTDGGVYVRHAEGTAPARSIAGCTIAKFVEIFQQDDISDRSGGGHGLPRSGERDMGLDDFRRLSRGTVDAPEPVLGVHVQTAESETRRSGAEGAGRREVGGRDVVGHDHVGTGSIAVEGDAIGVGSAAREGQIQFVGIIAGAGRRGQRGGGKTGAGADDAQFLSFAPGEGQGLVGPFDIAGRAGIGFTGSIHDEGETFQRSTPLHGAVIRQDGDEVFLSGDKSGAGRIEVDFSFGVLDGGDFACRGVDRDGAGEHAALVADNLDVRDVGFVHLQRQQRKDIVEGEFLSRRIRHGKQGGRVHITAAGVLHGGQGHIAQAVGERGHRALGIDGVPLGGAFGHFTRDIARTSVGADGVQGKGMKGGTQIVVQTDFIPAGPIEMRTGKIGLGLVFVLREFKDHRDSLDIQPFRSFGLFGSLIQSIFRWLRQFLFGTRERQQHRHTGEQGRNTI